MPLAEEILMPFAVILHSEKRECRVLLTKNGASVAAALPAWYSSLSPLGQRILHFTSRYMFCKSMKFDRSPTTSNSSVGPFAAYTGPIFCSNDVLKVIKRGGRSKISNELCDASTGNTLGNIFYS